MNEHSIQNDILVAITALPGAFFWRSNSGVAEIGGRFVRFNVPGCPDILGAYRGRFVGIEVKAAKGRQSDAQKRFQAAVTRGGGAYILARSVDDAITGLEAIV